MTWWKKLTLTHVFLIILLSVASFLRLYNLVDTLQFQGDQGRDALIVANIFRNFDPVFIGPVTSVGNMYLGPFYYYFMMPFLWLSYPSPMGPVYAVAGLGIITVWLLYYLGKELIGERAALIATMFYTFAAVVIEYTRFSWNPNPAPLVSLVMIWATHRAITKNVWYWVVVSICFSILIQLHYLTLLAGAGAGLVWLFQTWKLATTPASKKAPRWASVVKLGTATGVAIIVFALSLTPLMLFDYKHNWLNATAFKNLFVKEQSFKVSNDDSLPLRIGRVLRETHGRSLHILAEYNLGHQRTANTVFVIILLTIVIRQYFNQSKSSRVGYAVVASYLLTGIMGTAVYEHTIFHHYIAYLFPVTFLLYGIAGDWLAQKTTGRLLVGGLLIIFIAINLPKLPQSQDWTVRDIRHTAEEIVTHLKPEETYTVILLSESKDIYAQNYYYFLSTTDHPPLAPEKAGDASTLVVINEQHLLKPMDLPIYEIVIFPNKTPSETFRIDGGPEILIFRRT
ncbi:MAG TPA: glycosyltransferase family 39 protein [Vitreimonas sp.]|nr:glycosyltransferase family 39 protein [Vitreimonas sp.]